MDQRVPSGLPTPISALQPSHLRIAPDRRPARNEQTPDSTISPFHGPTARSGTARGPPHDGTFLPHVFRAQHHPAFWRGRGRVTERLEQSTSPGSALFAFASPCRVHQATAPRRRNEVRAERSQRHDGRRQENAGRPPGSTRPAGASPIVITLREPQRPNPRRARNGGSAPRPLHLTTGNFPSAAPGPRPVARAPDSRCGRPVHRVRWPAPGRRYPAHCG